jgi:hypothetical protein
MKKLFAVAVMVLGTLAFAQAPEGSKPAAQAKSPPQAQKGAAMAGWTPSRVTQEDKKGLDALWKAFGQAMMAQDLDKAADLVDFPVLMVSDDAQGKVVTSTWDRASWIANMKESMKSMPAPKDGKMPAHKMHYEFITNGIAVTTTTTRMAMGKKHMAVKSSSLLIHKDGQWKVKSMAEGGWGNEMTATGGSGK